MLNIANHELLATALVGYQHQLEDITARIAEINSKLGKGSTAGGRPEMRRIGAEGRKRTRHRIAPGPSQPGTVTAFTETPPQFVWVANGGGQRFHNNRFTIRFLNRDCR